MPRVSCPVASLRRFLLAAVVLITPLAVVAEQSGWHASTKAVDTARSQQPNFNFEEARVGDYTLPSVLGSAHTREQWPARRGEILEFFREHVYGKSPGRPDRLRFEVVEENAKAMDGAATLQRTAIVSTQAGREHRFGVTLFLPNARQGRVPVFLLINNRSAANDTDPTRALKSGFWPAEQLIERGYGIAALQYAELAPDNKDHYREGVIQLFEGPGGGPRPRNAWRALGAWAWGASRAMDYFETELEDRFPARRCARPLTGRQGVPLGWRAG